MKAGWTMTTIGEVCAVVNGGTPKSNVAAYWDGEVNWLTPKDMGKMNGRTIGETPRTITERGLNDSSARLVPPGAVIMSTRAPIGHLAINDVPMAFNQGCRAMVPNASLDHIYLYHYLSANVEGLNSLGTGATFKELSASALKGFPIPLPPLEEQQRIVAVLDDAFEGLDRARANAEANLADARKLFAESHRIALLPTGRSGPKVRLNAVASINSSLVDPRLDAYADLPHLGAGNMITGTDALIDVRTARQEGLKSGKYLFDDTMVLYSKIRPYLRKVSRPDFSGLCSADVYPLSPKSRQLDKNYLFYLLLGPDFTEFAINGSARAGMPKVNREHLFAYQFELPNLDQQVEIANRLDDLMQLTMDLLKDYQKKTEEVDALRQSLLEKAFLGELT